MDSIGAKVISCIILILTTILFGLLPLSLRRTVLQSSTNNSRASAVLSYLNCFAGGVFMGTTLAHLLPEVHEQLDAVLSAAGSKFPLSEFIAGCGFFLVMILERIVLMCCPETTENNIIPEDEKDRSAKRLSPHKENQSYYGSFNNSSGDTLCNTDTESQKDDTSGKHPGSSLTVSYIDRKSLSGGSSVDADNPTKCHSNKVHSIRALVLLLALSLHTVFEGLSLGLQDSAAGVWNLLIAVSIHKCIIAFTLGLQLMETQSMRRMIVFMTLFALMSPLGVGVGIGVTNIAMNEIHQSLTGGVLQGVATGTFLYVTFFEVLQKELGNDNTLLKVIPAIVGFGAMSCLTLLE